MNQANEVLDRKNKRTERGEREAEEKKVREVEADTWAKRRER